MRKFLDRISHSHLFILSLFLYAFIAYFIEREQFLILISGIGLLFGLLFIIYRKIHSESLFTTWLLGGFLIRFILIFSLPFLSDDIYRFYWDGLCSASGVSPFSYTPAELMSYTALIPVGLNEQLFLQLNSPDYYSVYPAFLQHIFSFSAQIVGPDNLPGFSMLLKLIILFFEAATAFILVKLATFYQIARKKVLLYTLNPLIILELNANVHFEVIMITFTLICIYLWSKNKYLSGTASLSLAVATKLVPLIFMPFLIRRVGWVKTIYLGLFLLVLNIIYHIPFMSVDSRRHIYTCTMEKKQTY